MTTPFGLEGAKGLGEKIQPLVQFPMLMRVVLPGGLATILVYPFTGLRTDFLIASLQDAWRELVLIALVPFFIGSLISAFGGKIYEIYEGRILWPHFLFHWLQAWQKLKVEGLLKLARQAKQEERNVQYDEIWLQLRMYPFDEKGDPYASRPTQLGNLLAAYEVYPETRYGMDSVFYWPRLWLELDKDKKSEIDQSWSVADGLLYLSAVSFCGGIVWFTAGLINAFFNRPPYLPFNCPTGTGAVALCLLLLGYWIYRSSLSFHWRNGETFKAVFDLYRGKLDALRTIGPAEAVAWRGTWAYLQYLSVYCLQCHKYYSAHEECCKYCSYPTAKSLGGLRRTELE